MRMSASSTITVEHEPGEPPLELTPEDMATRARVDAMTEEELYASALADPDAQPMDVLIAQGWKKGVNVKRLRERLGLTQEEFAKTYWIPLGTLRDWEQRRKNADRTAQAYLKVIEKDPAVVAALSQS
jgi:putative transcriptional regulator